MECSLLWPDNGSMMPLCISHKSVWKEEPSGYFEYILQKK